jgi:hypothetical protein
MDETRGSILSKFSAMVMEKWKVNDETYIRKKK